MPKRQTWVIKLGGSLIGSPSLHTWLKHLRELGHKRRIVVVPGGGPFAEVVRSTQADLRIGDCTAHAMAVQGMRQFGLAINGIAGIESSSGFSTVERLVATPGAPGFYVWDPLDEALVRSDLPADWTATSDSIAVWLGRRIAATGTVLVKSRSPHGSSCDAEVLAAESFVDAYLPVLLSTGPDAQAVWWLNSGAWPGFLRLLDGEALSANLITRPVQ